MPTDFAKRMAEVEALAAGAPAGPWTTTQDEYGDDVHITNKSRIDESRTAIAVVTVGFREPFESQQQAAIDLIAAAPSLVQLARDLHAALPVWRPIAEATPAGPEDKFLIRTRHDVIVDACKIGNYWYTAIGTNLLVEPTHFMERPK